jgi:hypothetical protein
MKDVDRLIAAVRQGQPLTGVPHGLEPLFRPSVAPFLRSLMDIDPSSLIAGAQCPDVAVIQGDMDLQVGVDADARRLAAARPTAKLDVIAGMAHTLKTEHARAQPQASYMDPTMPLSPGLVDAVALVATSARRH